MLCFDGVSAAYRGSPVLENVSFFAAAGEMTALLGRNGVGKTTLLRCLGGEKRDYTGKILLDGENVRDLDRARLARCLTCLPQNLPVPHVTVAELVAFGRAPYLPLLGKLRAEDREKVNWALENVGMTVHSGAFVDTLSGGQRKKAFLAMSLAQDTPVVLHEGQVAFDGTPRDCLVSGIPERCFGITLTGDKENGFAVKPL